MISKGLFTQILMIVLAVAIVITYIKPTFDEISKTQDDIALYKKEREKIDQVNDRLASLVEQINNVPASDQNKLLTYIPDAVDSVAVMRTIQIITEETGVLMSGLSYDGVADRSIESVTQAATLNLPIPHGFTLEIQGTYEQIKTTLALFEQNEYPLEIHELDLSVLEGSFMSASVSLLTYSRTLPEPSEFGIN